jgi:hypothetical protein
MSCETGIAPQALMDLPSEMFDMMIKVLKERAKEAKGENRNPEQRSVS